MNLEKIISQPWNRTFQIRAEDVNQDKRIVELSFSSEERIPRSYGFEVLDHKKSSIIMDRLQNGAPLLVGHYVDDQVGVIEKAWIDDRRGKALVRFSRSSRAEEIYQDVLDEIRRNVSVSYAIHKVVLEEENKEQSVYRVMLWEPLEISIVSVPADNTVGVGRSHLTGENKCLNNSSCLELSVLTKSEPFLRATEQVAAEVLRRLLP